MTDLNLPADISSLLAGIPYHVGFSVPDLDEAQHVLTAATGVRWLAEQFVEFPDYEVRYVYSVDGPPYTELCEGSHGSPWYLPGSGITLHHIGYWTEDFDRDSARMVEAGLDRVWDATGSGSKAAYFRAAKGSLLELVDISSRALLLERIEASRTAR